MILKISTCAFRLSLLTANLFFTAIYAQISPVIPGDLCWNTPTSYGSANYQFSSFRTLDLHVDRYGNSYTASYELSQTTGNGMRTYSYVITKYDEDGVMQWERDHFWPSLYVPNDNFLSAFVTGITADDQKNVYVCGQFDSERFILDSFEFNYTNAVNRGFIAQLDSNGVFQWVAILDASAGNYHAMPSVAEYNNHIYVTQWGAGTLRLPDGSTQVPNYPCSIIELDVFGNYIGEFTYTQQVNDVTGLLFDADPSVSYNHSNVVVNPQIEFAPSGKLFLVTRSRTSLSFGTVVPVMPTTLSGGELITTCAVLDLTSGWQNAFVVVYTDKDYDYDFFQRSEIKPVFTIDSLNNFYYADHWKENFPPGSHEIVALVNGDTLEGQQSDASAICKFSPTGAPIWQTFHSDVAWTSLAAGTNTVFAYGTSSGTFELNSLNGDSIVISNTGGENIVLAACSPAGNFTSAINFGGGNLDVAYLLKKSPCCDNIYFTGLQSVNNVIYNQTDTLFTTQPDQIFLNKHSLNGQCADPICALPDAIAEHQHPSPLKLYPVPASGFVMCAGIPDGIYQTTITDGQGRIVTSVPYVHGSGSALSVEGLAPGIYLVELRNEQGVATSKLVVE